MILVAMHFFIQQSQIPKNIFVPFADDFNRINARLLRPSAMAIMTDISLPKWQMALLGRGMEVRAGAGVGWFQLFVASAPSPGHVIIGLASPDASVADGQGPTKGWSGSGNVTWIPPSPALAKNVVTFGTGSRVMLVLDCRAEPLVRVLVNGKPCLVHTLQITADGPLTILCPAVALYGDRLSRCKTCVEVEAGPLPQGWDSAPAPS